MEPQIFISIQISQRGGHLKVVSVIPVMHLQCQNNTRITTQITRMLQHQNIPERYLVQKCKMSKNQRCRKLALHCRELALQETSAVGNWLCTVGTWHCRKLAVQETSAVGNWRCRKLALYRKRALQETGSVGNQRSRKLAVQETSAVGNWQCRKLALLETAAVGNQRCSMQDTCCRIRALWISDAVIMICGVKRHRIQTLQDTRFTGTFDLHDTSVAGYRL